MTVFWGELWHKSRSKVWSQTSSGLGFRSSKIPEGSVKASGEDPSFEKVQICEYSPPSEKCSPNMVPLHTTASIY